MNTALDNLMAGIQTPASTAAQLGIDNTEGEPYRQNPPEIWVTQASAPLQSTGN